MTTLHKTRLVHVQAEPESVSLREYLDMRLEMHRQAAIEQNRLQMAFAEERRLAMERRLDGMNEIRQQLNTQASSFCTVATFEQERAHQALSFEAYRQSRIEYSNTLEERMRRVETFQANINGRIIGFSAAFGIVGALLATIINFIHP